MEEKSRDAEMTNCSSKHLSHAHRAVWSTRCEIGDRAPEAASPNRKGQRSYPASSKEQFRFDKTDSTTLPAHLNNCDPSSEALESKGANITVCIFVHHTMSYARQDLPNPRISVRTRRHNCLNREAVAF